MSELNPSLLTVKFSKDISKTRIEIPRRYTLTHSDQTGELFLTVGRDFDYRQIGGWYTRLMRDEVLAEWEESLEDQPMILRVHCHVSGGLVLGTARWRYNIFNHHMRQVLQSLRYGDRQLVEHNPELDKAMVIVRYKARQRKFNKEVHWGVFGEYWVAEPDVFSPE
ncbi:MAG: staygreen family protein [Candidatus Promineifilaceae bacterium]